jgi:tetratricopeptide (TPR) repeat protein
VEESWQPASVDILLEDIDTILTGPDGVVVLQTTEGRSFELGNNSILDISDLRKISEKELFLYLMSKKVQKIEPRNGKTPLRIGKVSVVHGESKVESETVPGSSLKSDFLLQEKNGARALHEQKLYPNSIIKYHKILEKYNTDNVCGEIHFYLGKSLEALNQIGQAIDAYQETINRNQQPGCDNHKAKKWSAEAQLAIEKLKQKK